MRNLCNNCDGQRKRVPASEVSTPTIATHKLRKYLQKKIPASEKSTLARELVRKLNERGIYPALLKSDVMRAILAPEADYGRDDRDRFYRQLADVGAMLTAQGLPVIFDATANRKAYRDHARSLIRRFIEVYIVSGGDLQAA